MTVDEFADTLKDVCIADESTDFLDQVDAAARAAVLAGAGTMGAVTAASVNGKSFSVAITLSPVETLRACTIARGLFNGTRPAQVTQPDWSRSLGGNGGWL